MSKNKILSDTPRTDEANKQYQVDVYDNPKGFCVTEPVHASFARKLERENAELRKDKERLDWLLSKGLAWNGCYRGDWREGEWMYGNSTFNSDARYDIDKEMEVIDVED